jgi:hypothetical protein
MLDDIRTFSQALSPTRRLRVFGMMTETRMSEEQEQAKLLWQKAAAAQSVR